MKQINRKDVELLVKENQTLTEGKSPELQFPRQVQVPGIKPGESRQEYKGGGGYLNKNSKSRKGEAKRKEKKRKEDISIRRIRICRQSEMN